MTISEKIKSFRIHKKMTQKKLGELTGIGEKTIQKYELGIRNPKPEQLKKIADALGVGINAFLEMTNFTFSCETVADFMGILIMLSNSNLISIEGEREKSGFLNPKTVSIRLKNNAVLSGFLKLNLDEQGQITPDRLSIKIHHAIILKDLINWEKANYLYTESVSKYCDNPDEATKAAIAYMAELKEKIEMECQRSMVMLDTSDGIKVKINPDII